MLKRSSQRAYSQVEVYYSQPLQGARHLFLTTGSFWGHHREREVSVLPSFLSCVPCLLHNVPSFPQPVTWPPHPVSWAPTNDRLLEGEQRGSLHSTGGLEPDVPVLRRILRCVQARLADGLELKNDAPLEDMCVCGCVERVMEGPGQHLWGLEFVPLLCMC